MKKNITIPLIVLVIIIIAIVLIVVAGINKKSNLSNGNIRIERTFWSGEPDYVPDPPDIIEEKIELNKEITISEFSVKIIKISQDSITIKTNTAMSESSNGRNRFIFNTDRI